jgi:TPR repeat protein
MLYYVGTPHVPSNEEQKMAWLRKGAELGHVRSQATLGSVYYLHANLIDAEKWLALAAAEGDSQAKIDLENVARSREFDRQAAEAFAKLKPENLDASILADPKNPSLYEKRAVTRLLAGKDDLALQDAEKVIELRPDDDDGYGLRFFALTFLGRDAEAQKAKEAFVAKFSPKKAAQLDQGLAELKKARGK